GLTAGYLGGAWDNAINRVMDVFFSIPGLLLAVGVAAMRGPGVNSAVVAITIVYTPLFARVMRGPVLAEREKEYIEAVRALGAGWPVVTLKHLLPNVLSPFVVQGTVAFSQAILIEASLSYLGLSAQPPAEIRRPDRRRLRAVAPRRGPDEGRHLDLGPDDRGHGPRSPDGAGAVAQPPLAPDLQPARALRPRHDAGSRAGRVVADQPRRAHVDVQAAPGREVPRRPGVHLGGREVLVRPPAREVGRRQVGLQRGRQDRAGRQV